MQLLSFQSAVLLTLLAFAGNTLFIAIRAHDVGRIIIFSLVVLLLIIVWLLVIGIFH